METIYIYLLAVEIYIPVQFSKKKIFESYKSKNEIYATFFLLFFKTLTGKLYFAGLKLFVLFII